MVGPHPFSLFEFFTDPLKTFSFICLIITTLSFWAYKRVWIWAPLLSFACVCAYFSKLMDIGLLIPIISLFLTYWILSTNISGIGRVMVIFIIILISLGFSFHLFPNVHNWLLADSLHLSQGAPPFTYYWNFDKPFIGLFVLGFHLHLLRTKEELKPILTKAIAITFCFIALFLTGALLSGIVSFDFKFSSLTPIWLIGNLFFTVIPEEAFFRGFLQQELTKAIPTKTGSYIANFIISILFAIAHIFFISNPAYILLAFLASFFYGLLYQITRSIEVAIFAHYLLNVIHFIFFTYPLLQS